VDFSRGEDIFTSMAPENYSRGDGKEGGDPHMKPLGEDRREGPGGWGREYRFWTRGRKKLGKRGKSKRGKRVRGPTVFDPMTDKEGCDGGRKKGHRLTCSEHCRRECGEKKRLQRWGSVRQSHAVKGTRPCGKNGGADVDAGGQKGAVPPEVFSHRTATRWKRAVMSRE